MNMNMHAHVHKHAYAWVKVSGLGEALPLADSSVDAVVCTLTLCSVRDPAAAVAEVRRGGLFLTLTLTLALSLTLALTLTLTGAWWARGRHMARTCPEEKLRSIASCPSRATLRSVPA